VCFLLLLPQNQLWFGITTKYKYEHRGEKETDTLFSTMEEQTLLESHELLHILL